MISRATSSETSSDHRSAVLNATTQTRSQYCPDIKIGDGGLEVALSVSAKARPSQSEVIDHNIGALVCAVRHDGGSPSPTHGQLLTQQASTSLSTKPQII